MPTKIMTRLMAGTAVSALLTGAAFAATANARPYDIPQQDAATALQAYAMQSGKQVLFPYEAVKGKQAPQIKGDYSDGEVIALLANSAGLMVTADDGKTVTLRPQAAAAAQGGDEGTVQALIVTAQKREENIQDVPIAMSAFTQEDLTKSQVTGGPDLMTQVPNFTFTKTNFSGYSIQIRGIGTQAISAAVDPAVAVAFNNIPFLRNHFFEQEFYDLERVEVLRGPQGTLYGRNATAGVVNILSAKPKFHFEAKASADVGNYNSTRLEGMINLPLVEDKAALRIAGAWTKRDGYDTNQITGHPIDGRDLWSTRVSLRIDPTERLRTNFVWEHFNENDDRLRSGKQTCETAHVPDAVNGVPTSLGFDTTGGGVSIAARYMDQGCLPTSLYSPEAFQVPDGTTLSYYLPLAALSAPIAAGWFGTFDVYSSTTQSRNLRVIESQIDPVYRAQSDTLEYNVEYDIAPALTLSSQTGFSRDFLWSSEDYNRFNTRRGAFLYCANPGDGNCANPGAYANNEIVPDPQGGYTINDLNLPNGDPNPRTGEPCDPAIDGTRICQPNGMFCDPQVGCAGRLVLEDLSEERSRQFTQEFRLASNFDGPFNFSIGANYIRYKTEENYYVFINTITLTAGGPGFIYGARTPWVPGVSDNSPCLLLYFTTPFAYVNPKIPSDPQINTCAYIDPNPITSLNNQGHNYFLSQNPYKLQSYAVFGEAYYNITPELKLTAGLRWTDDKKHFVEIPSELLVAGYGYPVTGTVDQEWREPTGRLVLDWTPQLGFTDKTLVYGSITHGYKAGGANPPGAVLLTNRGGDIANPIHPLTFKPEFVNAFELGTKNTLLDGKLTFNLNGFYYDYTGYQISEIVDRSAINLNFDAKIWGAEMETDWRPLENLRLGLKVGYEDTRMAKGSHAVDLMDRTGGHSDWMVIKPFVTQASNCILPKYVVAAILYAMGGNGNAGDERMDLACGVAYSSSADSITGVVHADPATRMAYTPNPTQTFDGKPIIPGYRGFDPTTAPNGGAGFDKDLSGHALPNAPHFTTTLTADYTLPLPHDWLMTLHGDFYQQSEAWARVFNMPGYDKLKAYNNVNLAAIFANDGAGWTVMAYVKNVFNKDNITGAFLNSDDSGLTTNVFLNEPRLYGIRVTKAWTDSPWWSAHAHTPGAPYPFRLELEGYHGPDSQDHELLATPTTAMFPSDFPFPFKPQRDLGWGSGGGVKFTYQPNPGGWNISGGVRYGRAVGATQLNTKQALSEICISRFGSEFCDNPSNGSIYINGQPNPAHTSGNKYNYTDSLTKNEEDHAVADFTVGKDVGLGSTRLTSSAASVGFRYARLRSTSDAALHGLPDLYWNPHNAFKYPSHLDRFAADMQVRREFQGMGPAASWNGGLRLFGDADKAGRIDLDMGLGGGVLFGKQKTQVRGQESGSHHTGYSDPAAFEVSSYNRPLNFDRTKSVSVPTVNANLGLSYSVGGLKVSGGYRAERYFKAIDGGIAERKTYDRDINGAYAKVSIAFGG